MQLDFRRPIAPPPTDKSIQDQLKFSTRSNYLRYCFNRKNKFPVGAMTVMLFVPFAVMME